MLRDHRACSREYFPEGPSTRCLIGLVYQPTSTRRSRPACSARLRRATACARAELLQHAHPLAPVRPLLCVAQVPGAAGAAPSARAHTSGPAAAKMSTPGESTPRLGPLAARAALCMATAPRDLHYRVAPSRPREDGTGRVAGGGVFCGGPFFGHSVSVARCLPARRAEGEFAAVCGGVALYSVQRTGLVLCRVTVVRD